MSHARFRRKPTVAGSREARGVTRAAVFSRLDDCGECFRSAGRYASP